LWPELAVIGVVCFGALHRGFAGVGLLLRDGAGGAG